MDSSRFIAGELVEVRSREEILRTLDASGCLEALPFMPEMLRYCGRQFRVYKRAHKTCDFVNKTGLRALPNCVHLEGLRCDGSAHGGCQAQCLFFWKDAWLKRPNERSPAPTAGEGCSEAQLWCATRADAGNVDNPDPVFACQATRLPAFTRPLAPWDIRQYVEDYRSGNVRSVWTFMARAAYRALDTLINLGIGLGRPLRWLYDHGRSLRGRPSYPGHPGWLPRGGKTPSSVLNLQPGELVRVKDHAAILATIDEYGKNRGMSFSAEMAPYCGRTFRVLSRVNRIIDEKSGRMLRMKSECIILEGVICQAQFNKGMILCPRATYPYWREIWLERVTPAPPSPQTPHTSTARPPAISSPA